MSDTPNITPAELRAQAEKMERENAAKNKGRVFVSSVSGFLFIHDGGCIDESMTEHKRELSESEVEAIRTIPECAAALRRIRGQA